MAMSAIINHYRIEDRDVSEHRCPFCSYEWLEWSDADDYPYYCPSCGGNFDGEETVVKYFSTRRPLAPGSCPDALALHIRRISAKRSFVLKSGARLGVTPHMDAN